MYQVFIVNNDAVTKFTVHWHNNGRGVLSRWQWFSFIGFEQIPSEILWMGTQRPMFGNTLCVHVMPLNWVLT